MCSRGVGTTPNLNSYAENLKLTWTPADRLTRRWYRRSQLYIYCVQVFDPQQNLVVCTVDSQLSIEPLTINVFQRRMWHRRYENIFTTILLPMRVVGVSLLPCERKQRRGSSELGTLSGHVKDHDRPHSSPSLTHHVLVRLSQQRGT